MTLTHSTSSLNVHKFGGTSLADTNRFKTLQTLLTGKNEIIVVSAMKDTTSNLQTMLDLAKNGKDFSTILNALEIKHLSLIDELLTTSQQADIKALIQKDCVEIKNILTTVTQIGSYAAEIQDYILGYGEQWSAQILTLYLAQFNRVIYLDAAKVLFAFYQNGILCIDWEKSQQHLNAFLKDKSFDQLVVTGFIASTLDGKRTTLGRNGSDFSGAIFAKLFAAKALYIWTDVDGIYTADPQKVRSAFAIAALSYNEALELAYFGAKVLHPMTIAPALESRIPIYIKNSLNPSASGTCISEKPTKSPYLIKGITCIDDVTLINIEGTGMIGVSGIAARVFTIMQEINISVVLITQASSEHSICFVIPKNRSADAVAALTHHLQFEIAKRLIEKVYADNDCAILAVVGDDMVGTIGASGKLCDTLAKANVNIHAIAQGSSERNISVVINKSDQIRAMQAVHAGFYLSNKTISIGIIGPGAIGTTLIQQIADSLQQLKIKKQIDLRIRGIMNSKKMLLQHNEIDLNNWQTTLEKDGIKPSLNEFIDHIAADDIPHAVIIDCTANPAIAKHYIEFAEKGVHIITPNKFTNSGDLDFYKQLKKIVAEKNRYYLYEATVCAGLPVINTLQDILATGDEVIAVQGVVSGTLSYIFSELAKGKSFSDAVLEAKKLGFTEPDPREDLSGMDVARKLVCLAREIGHDVSLSDVKVHDLVPPALKSVPLPQFLEQLKNYDHEISALIEKAKHEHKQLCYSGAIHQDGRLTVAMDSVDAKHPFSRLKGTDNMIVLYTRRYHEQPLIIQGPGAGKEVTAAGIFADLLRLASFLA